MADKLRIYSLSDFVVNILANDANKEITIKATDNNLGTISWDRKSNHTTITGDAAGGAVANINKDKTGTITISMDQTSPYAAQLVKFFNATENNEYDYVSEITISGVHSPIDVVGHECLAQKLPAESLDQESGQIEFVFEVTTLIVDRQ